MAKLTAEKREELVQLIVANSTCGDCETETTNLRALSEDHLLLLAANMDSEEMDDEEGPAPKKKKKAAPTTNSDSRTDGEKWWDSAPQSIKDLVTNANEVLREQQDQYISQITANENNPYEEKELRKMSVSMLKKLAAFGSASSPVTNSGRYPSFLGGAGGAPTVTNKDKGSSKDGKGTPVANEEDDDLLSLPVMNFGQTSDEE